MFKEDENRAQSCFPRALSLAVSEAGVPTRVRAGVMVARPQCPVLAPAPV